MNNTFVFPIVQKGLIIPAIKSLRENTPPGFKVIVVDQTKYDPVFSQVLWKWADIVIKPHLNMGFAQSSNIGARIATTDLVTIANDDIIAFWPGWWNGILETFEEFPTAMAVGPMSPKEPGWGFGESGYRLHATLDECLEDPEGVVERLKKKWGNSVIDSFAMWFAVLKRQEWADLGMFDERFFPGGGEDYCAMWRIYNSGCRAISTPKSWLWHMWGQSKDEPSGLDDALPPAREPWNKLSTKGFGDEGLYDPDVDCWGRTGRRTDPNVYQAPL